MHVEFLDSVNRQNRRGISCNAGAVDDALAGEGFAVEKPVDEVCVVLGAETVCAGGGKSTARIAHDAGAKLQQIFVIAAVQRQIVDLLSC